MSQRMTIDEMIAVLEAAKEGKIIEFQDINDPGEWFEEAMRPSWDFYRLRFRVKPELMERWIVIMGDGGIFHFKVKERAIAFHEDHPGSRLVHLREVES